jgi:hypothetical protein
VNPYEAPDSEGRAKLVRRRARSWFFAVRFAVAGCLLGGSGVFYLGFRALTPPPPPPGQANCGDAVLGGLLVMVVVAPLAAILSAALAAILGAMVDLAANHREQPRLDP